MNVLNSSLVKRVFIPKEILDGPALCSSLNSISERWPHLNLSTDESPVFIFSAGWGSGSTLLQRLLLSSNEVGIWGEPLDHTVPIVRLSSSLIGFNSAWPPNKFFGDMKNLNNLSGKWVANLTPDMQNLYDAHKSFIMSWLAAPVLKEGYTRWGLKEVRLTIDHARYLKWIFPKSKFIFLYRNVFNSYLSIKNTGWYNIWPDSKIDNPLFYAHHWKYLLNGYIEGCNDVDGILVKYEDLITGQYDLSALCDHLQIDKIDDSVLVKKIRQRGKVNKLNYLEKYIINSITSDLLTKVGYK